MLTAAFSGRGVVAGHVRRASRVSSAENVLRSNNRSWLRHQHGMGDRRHRPIFTPAEVWRTILNIRKWPHFLATASIFATWSPLTTYTPSVIMSLGFSKVEANGLAAVGSILTLPVVFLFAWLSDRAKKPGVTVIAAIAVYLVALILLRTVQSYASTWGKFGLWTAVNAFAVGYHPIHNAWIQVKCRTPEERSISLACVFLKSCLLTKSLLWGRRLTSTLLTS